MRKKIRLEELETTIYSNSSELKSTAEPITVVVAASLVFSAGVAVATWFIK